VLYGLRIGGWPFSLADAGPCHSCATGADTWGAE
jgi:hypothetical protein